MRGSRFPSCALALLLVALGSSSEADPKDDPVVVRVGESELRVSDVERRLRALPPAQLASLGSDADAIRHRFVQSVLVPELLYGEAARAKHLEQSPWVSRRVREVYHRAVQTSLTDEALAADPITDEAIGAYYEEHRSDFQKEERLLLWRILVDDADLAKKIIADARGVGGPDRWKDLAREHSKDTATHLRAGTLGFVGKDGTTDVPQVRVDPILYAEAAKVRDGELVPEPVREGEHLAVVWRRGTRPAMGRTLEEAAVHIRGILERQRAFAAMTELLRRGRKDLLVEHHPELLDHLPKTEPEALRPSRAAPGPSRGVSPAAPAPSGEGDPGPVPSGDDLR